MKPNNYISEHRDFIDVNDYIRIYFTPKTDKNGFDGEIIELLEWCDGTVESWNSDSERRIIGKFNAAFDGIRHLYLGENGEGYIHCPCLNDWRQIITCLETLQKTYCRET
jgi:hypothetical protein